MNPTFTHQNLDCYKASIDLVSACQELLANSRPGHDKLKDNLQRSVTGIPLLIAEGVSRRSAGQQRQRLFEARGEAGEVGAALEVGVVVGLFDKDRAEEAHVIAVRIAQMLTKLARRA